MRRGEKTVNRFAIAMVDKLNEPKKIEKGDWKNEDTEELFRLLEDEIDELYVTLHGLTVGKATKEDVLKEAADVANYAMFIADNCGALK
jgi:hypothetical protein